MPTLRDQILDVVLTPLARVLPACDRATELLSRRLDGAQLSLRDRAVLRLHLLTCVYCRRCADQMAFLRTVLRTPGPDGAPDRQQLRLSPRMREQLEKLMVEAQGE